MRGVPAKLGIAGHGNVVRERIELKHSSEVGFSLLEVCEVICIEFLVDRLCELSEHLLHWSVRGF